MKKTIYISAFTTLGILLGVLVHALIEMFYIKLLLANFTTFSFGLDVNSLQQFGAFFAVIIIAVCGFWGYSAGKYWWRQIYVLNAARRWKHWFKH